MLFPKTVCLWAIVGAFLGPGLALAQAAPNQSFAPLEQWRSLVATGDSHALEYFYSANPAAKITTSDGEEGMTAEIAFWTGLKVRNIRLESLQTTSPQPDLQMVTFLAEVKSRTGRTTRTVYVQEGQLWQQQNGQWRIAAVKRGNVTRLEPAVKDKDIYPAGIDARSAIKAAMARAHSGPKRVLVVFGANWCYDCHVLDQAFERADLTPVLEKNYEVVHVDVGRGDKNQDLMDKYQVPMKRGIPAVAVLDSDGKLLYSQKGGEFEKARSLAPEDLLQFLNKWKPQPR